MFANDPILEARRQWVDHGWGDVADSMAVVTSVIRAQQLLMARMDEAVRPHGLTFARFELLRLLAFTRTGALPLGKIGVRLQVHPASVTNAVDRLEADRLVRRTPHPTDGRTTLATITARGRRVVAAATTDVNAVFAELDLPPSLVEDLAVVRERAGDAAATRFSRS
ncbi:MAG TPA: MarR family transcriptional regulator [Acidimicrobiales bacterium]|nr:MarR family transcriptional regulator [Acidimicrobiales bacterium]